MNNHYTALVEKIEKQNAYQLRDKLEAYYQLRDAASAIAEDQKRHEKLLKVVIALQIATAGYTHSDSLASILKVLL